MNRESSSFVCRSLRKALFISGINQKLLSSSRTRSVRATFARGSGEDLIVEGQFTTQGAHLSSPQVSVVLPSHNAGRFLRASVTSILEQSFGNFELLLIDDASTDNSFADLSDIGDDRVRILRNAHKQGLAAALNRGIAESSSPLIARMDADDVAITNRLNRQISFLEANPSVMVVGTDVQPIDEFDQAVGKPWLFPVLPWQIRWRMLFSCSLAHPSVVARREFFEQVGLYAEDHPAGSEDYELWLRAFESIEMANLPAVLLLYRRHSESTTLSQTAHLPYVRAAARRAIERIIQRSVSNNQLDALSDPAAAQSRDSETFILAAGILHDLFEWFNAQPLSDPERSYVRYRAAWTLRAILRTLGKTDLKEAVRVARSSPLLTADHLIQALSRKLGWSKGPDRL